MVELLARGMSGKLLCPSRSGCADGTVSRGWRRSRRTEAAPEMERNQTKADDDELRRDEENQPLERCVHESIGVQADAEHVYTEPGEAGDDIAENGEIHDAAVANDATPTRV